MQTLEYIEDAMPPETPTAFGLHANAEVGFKRREAERFCAALQSLQPRQLGGEAGLSVEERAKLARAHSLHARHAHGACMCCHLLRLYEMSQHHNMAL